MQIKHLIIGVLVVLLGVVGFRACNQQDVLSDRISMVCVETGERREVAREEIRTLPVENPSTGRKTMIPYVDHGGRVFVENRFRELLESLKEQNHYVDPETLEVKDEP